MAEIRDLDGVSRSILDAVKQLDEGKMTAETLNAKRCALATVVRIAEIKLSVARLMKIMPSAAVLQIEAR